MSSFPATMLMSDEWILQGKQSLQQKPATEKSRTKRNTWTASCYDGSESEATRRSAACARRALAT